MIMNIKTFMAIAVVALTAACSEATDVTTNEAVNAMATDDNVEAAAPDAETPLTSPII